MKSSGNSSYMESEHQNNLPTQCLTQINLGELKPGMSNGKKKVLEEEDTGLLAVA